MERRPRLTATLGFGVFLLAWWVITIEIPGRNLFLIAAQRGIERALAPVTVWTYAFTQRAMLHRWWAFAAIAALLLIHRWLWVRREKWDVYGKWLFKAGFFVFYLLLYLVFMIVFIGAELPIWQWPGTL